jgi:hypothetical protein
MAALAPMSQHCPAREGSRPTRATRAKMLAVLLFLVHEHSWCGCSASATLPGGFQMPTGPNTEKLLRGMVRLAPPLSDFPGIFGAEGPRVQTPSSTGKPVFCLHNHGPPALEKQKVMAYPVYFLLQFLLLSTEGHGWMQSH